MKILTITPGGGGGQNVSLLLPEPQNFEPALKKLLGGTHSPPPPPPHFKNFFNIPHNTA